MPQIEFEVVAECRETRARAGLLHTPHGTIETPVFMPVGTQASVKGLTQSDLAGLGAQTKGEKLNEVHGAVQVGPRSRIRGALFSEQAIALHEDAQVQGPVVSEVRVDLGPGVVIGRLEHPSTLSAPQLLAQAGAVVHGTAWASQSGRVV